MSTSKDCTRCNPDRQYRVFVERETQKIQGQNWLVNPTKHEFYIGVRNCTRDYVISRPCDDPMEDQTTCKKSHLKPY